MSAAECELVRRQAQQTRAVRKFGTIATAAHAEAKAAHYEAKAGRNEVLAVRKEVKEGFQAQRGSIGDLSENVGKLASDGARQQKEHQSLKKTIGALATKKNGVILFAMSFSTGLASHAGEIIGYVLRHLP